MVKARAAVAAALAFLSLGGAPAAAAEGYLIGGGDSLQVNVWKNPELSQTVVVRPDGMITLPLVRDIRAAGMTPMDLGEAIEGRLSAFVNAPNVTVTVGAATNFRVYTHGAIASGMFQLAAPIDALQLLARAGGGTAEADLGRAYILRGGGRVPVDLQPTGAGKESAYPLLLPQDVLVVPYRDAAMRVLVIGEVKSPRSLPFHEGMTFLDAFIAAGGGSEYADLDSVRIVRVGADRRQEEIRIDVSRMLKKGDLGRNIALSPGDIIVVPE